jgi:HEAT repeat protein
MKVIRMNAPRTHIILLLIAYALAAGSLWVKPQTAGAQELPLKEEMNPDTEMDKQLGVYKTALLEGKSDKSRMDAAGLLLSSEHPAARAIVLDVLQSTGNPQARATICEALNPARIWPKPLKNKEDFIKPLIAILTSEEDTAIARLAAEATLIFGYHQVQQDLEKAVMDPSLSVNARVNVIYAMKRHPDKAAVIQLVRLVSSPEPAIVEAVRTALASLGLSVSLDPAARRQMLAELQERGVEAFLRERLVRQETRMRELEIEVSALQKRYLAALGSGYDSLPNDAAKIDFLARQLSSPEIIVRSWALDKLQELRYAKGTLKLTELLEPILPALISDSNRQVRFKTARVLALMGELNTSKALLDQLKVEPDEQIKREILVALGEACYAGSMAGAGRKVPDEIRREALDWAVAFLKEPDVEKARSGAAVLGKLLEQDGFKPDEVERYLNALSDRYVQIGAGTEPILRGYLLGAMAGLCSTRSTCREQAVQFYSGFFEQALADQEEIVRQNAMDGCVNVDKMGALRKLREKMAADASVPIRKKLISLAGEVGTPQDLDWLAEKMGVADEGEPAWQAMLQIFKRAPQEVLTDWAGRLEVLAATGKAVVEQRIAFFTLVEQKAQSENRAEVVKETRTNLARLYLANNNFKQASDCLESLLPAAATEEERQRLHAQLLRAYLGLADIEKASGLIHKCLSGKNLDLTNNYVVKSVEEYLSDPKTTDPTTVVGVLQQIKLKDPDASRKWELLLGRWIEYAKAKKPEDSGRAHN